MVGGDGEEDVEMHEITLLEIKSDLTHQIENTFVVCFLIIISITFSLYEILVTGNQENGKKTILKDLNDGNHIIFILKILRFHFLKYVACYRLYFPPAKIRHVSLMKNIISSRKIQINIMRSCYVDWFAMPEETI